MRSLIRQCLNVDNMSAAVESCLADIVEKDSWEAQDLQNLFQHATSDSTQHFVIIDGLDECVKVERGKILKILQKIGLSSSTSLKIFVASRDSIEQEIKQHFQRIHHVKISHLLTGMDIQIYIDGVLEEKVKNKDLIICDPSVCEEIRVSLSEGAQGMWV